MSQEEGDRLRKRFNVLAKKAEAFFEEAGGHHGRHGALPTRTGRYSPWNRRRRPTVFDANSARRCPCSCRKFRMHRCCTNEIWSGLQSSVARWMLLSGLSRFAVTKSATSLPTCFERHARKLGNCSNFCREKTRGNRQLPSEALFEVAQLDRQPSGRRNSQGAISWRRDCNSSLRGFLRQQRTASGS